MQDTSKPWVHVVLTDISSPHFTWTTLSLTYCLLNSQMATGPTQPHGASCS